jgi:mevalonate kinase
MNDIYTKVYDQWYSSSIHACCSYIGSGLSSSAAFVCSATIAIMGILGKNFPKVLLTANQTVLLMTLPSFGSCHHV